MVMQHNFQIPPLTSDRIHMQFGCTWSRHIVSPSVRSMYESVRWPSMLLLLLYLYVYPLTPSPPFVSASAYSYLSISLSPLLGSRSRNATIRRPRSTRNAVSVAKTAQKTCAHAWILGKRERREERPTIHQNERASR